jgi:hypothetical protein
MSSSIFSAWAWCTVGASYAFSGLWAGAVLAVGAL